MPGLDAVRNKVGGILHIEKPFVRVFLAEFIGTAVLVIIGDGSVAQVVLSGKLGAPCGDFFTINVAFAFAIAYGVYLSGSVSGGHINPAVTVVMAVLGRCKWLLLPFYWAGQYLGAFFGAAIVYWVYYAAIHEVDHRLPDLTAGGKDGPNLTAGIFATYPAADWLTSGHGFVDQMIGTAILLLAVCALTDPQNLFIPAHYTPIIIGFVVGSVGMSFGYNAGFALNPARDLGPRIFSAFVYGGKVFSVRNYDWFWVPIIGPHVGAFVGMFTYKLLVGLHWPTRPADVEPQHEEEQIRLTKHRLPE